MKRPTRRTILKVMLLLAAGAAVSILVTWGTLTWGFMTVSDEAWPLDDDLLQSVREKHGIQVWEISAERSPTMRLLELRGAINNAPSVVQHIVAGWPMHALAGTKVGTISPTGSFDLCDAKTNWALGIHEWNTKVYSNNAMILPLQPLWPGFAVNTVFYAGMLWALFAGPFALRRMIRKRRGCCAQCGYPVGASEACTECGAAHRAFRMDACAARPVATR